MDTRPALALQLSGAPRLLVAGAERALPGRRALALAAVLAADGPTTRARLAALLWARLDEPSARRNLRRELARLREAGLGALLAGDEVLSLADGVTCDLADIERALAQHDPELALALWRGPLLEGVELGDAPAFDDWLAERRAAWQRRWRDATVAAAQAREAGGDLRGALELRLRLVEADPLGEPEVVHAMRLHERLGDRPAALALYERCRRQLAAELGLEPLAETAALAERLRTGERVAAVLPRAVRPAWERLDAPLVGRAAEAARLHDSAAPLLLVEGEPGVGKTRLAQEGLRARSTVLLRCTAAGRGGALQPVAEVLADALARLAGAERLATLPPATRRELARLVPAFDAEAAAAPARTDAAAQRRFLDALADALDALASADGTPGTWLVDDLHWADEATLALLRHAAHRRARAPERHARVVATARSAELADDPAAGPAVLALEREGLLERLPLAPLAEADTLALVRELSDSGGGELFARRLQRSTAGNPYHLLETLRFLFDAGELQVDERGGWRTRYDDATADYAELPVPPSVAQTVVERVDRLGAAARRVLEAAALAGDGFTLDDVQPATALSAFDALEGLERALDARLIAAAEPGYRFVHDLARGAIDARLGPERRRLVHARLAQGLVARGGAPSRIAQHFEGAGDPVAAVPWRLQAADAAQRVFARREALAHLAAALAAAPDAATRLACHRQRVPLLRDAGDMAGCDAEIERYAALADTAGDAAAQFRAALFRVMRCHDRARFDDALALCLDLETRPAPSPEDRLTLMRLGGFVALHQDRGAMAERWLGEALALATQLADPVRTGVEANLIHLRVSAGQAGEAVATFEHALAHTDAGVPVIERSMLFTAGMRAYEGAGDRARARWCAAEALSRARQVQVLKVVENFLANRMRLELEDGDLDAARATWAEILAGAEASAWTLPRQQFLFGGLQGRLAWAEGRADDAIAALEAACRALDGDPGAASNAHGLIARYRALRGDFAGACRAAAAAAAAQKEVPPPLLLHEAVLAWRALAQGDAAAARARLVAAFAVPPALDEFQRLHQDLAACVLGAAHAALGDTAAALDAVRPVGSSPALVALALAVRLAAGDAAAPAAARALLQGGRVPPVERGVLERALAGTPPFR